MLAHAAAAEEEMNEGPIPNTLLPLASGVQVALQTLARAAPGAELRPSPFCYEDAHEVRGFALDVPCDAPATALPLPHNLFHGLALARCDIPEADALGYLQRADETRARLSAAVASLKPPGEEAATWARCRPSGVPLSLYGATRDRDGRIVFEPPDTQPPLLENAPWTPELSPDGFVGLFFEWCAESQRLHLYVACQSYLLPACAEFAHMAHQAAPRCAAAFICLSDEAQWLRSACARNRARIIARVCAHMGLRVPLVRDYCGGEAGEDMAMVHAETLHHDLAFVSAGGQQQKVRLLSYCAPEARAGSLCVMAPWDGLWLFRGGRNGGSGWLFPTTTPRVRTRTRHWSFSVRPRRCRLFPDEAGDFDDLALASLSLSHLPPQDKKKKKPQKKAADMDDAELIRDALRQALERSPPPLSEAAVVDDSSSSHYYLVFDETVLQRMTALGWARALGVNKLLPLGIVPWRDPSRGAGP